MSYCIPAERLSLAQQERLRGMADTMCRSRLAKKLVIDLSAALNDQNPAVICRDADYVVDFVPAANQAGLAGWLTQPMLAAGGFYSVFANNLGAPLTPIVLNNQEWVFYGIDILDADAAKETVTQIRFGIGAAANRRAQFDLEGLYSGQASSGYFSQPVWYDPQEIATVQVRARIPTGAGARVRLMALIAEPVQQTVI